MSELTNQIAVVVQARDARVALDQQVKTSREAWEKENSVLIGFQIKQRETTIGAEDKLRLLTIEAYELNGVKQPAPGLGIRENTIYTYDEKEAYRWAIEHKMALSLDRKAFVGMVKAQAKTDPISFVEVSIDVSATIATELKVVEE